NSTGLTKTGFRNTLDTADLTDFTGSVLGPVTGKQLGIYGVMLQAIRDSKESVFIDLFWMGGSIGMNLAKELMKKVIENPDFTVMIITDNENKFQYGTQLDMIYRYMRAFSEKFPHLNFYITPAQIGLKRTALPEFADLLVTNSVVNDLSANGNIKSFLEDDGFHLLAKSDHTKAMIMDGKNPETGKAFVGSKNWTDSSGGVNQDQMAEVRGPAVALILDTFYYDVLEAFKLDLDPRLGGEMVKNHIQAKVGSETKQSQAIKQLLAPIDVQNRTSGFLELPYVVKGDAVVAPAQNNAKGTEMSPLEQNIQLILGARHQILIDDQFLYDPKVVDAIKFAKIHNGVDIYVFVESLIGYGKDENGNYIYDAEGSFPYDYNKGIQIPNNLFIPELADLDIETRAYVRPQHVIEAMSEDQRVHNESHPILGATFHVKSISVDGVLKENADTCESLQGPVLVNPQTSAPATVSGSANKDIMTMSGGFREAQVATYGEAAVGTHDCLFWTRWRDRSVPSRGTEFDLPAQAAQMGVDNPEDFLTVLKSILFTPYNFTKDHL
ncbi:MAG: hypothetical protein HRT44_13490, partial [Bdellovibrionales bacterium]|nr:phospholipase D-like domain-containing protein [Bdellovibrionales bacterium]NQZ20252.1 hypothetical protein [Bdellovibrionales bacterium]